jgi:uncharacterized membrane protein
MEEILNIISKVIGGLGAAIIVWGVILTTFRLIFLEFKRFRHKTILREREMLRHKLGSYLLLGLEFLISADIIATIVDPTLNGIAILASIVAIRTVISYFLEKEVLELKADGSLYEDTEKVLKK